MTKIFNAEAADVVSVEDIGEYPLPFNPDYVVRIKSVSMARMNEFTESNKKGGAVAAAAVKNLIRESIVDEEGKPVYTKDTAEKLLKGRTRLVGAFIKMISRHNGADDEIDEFSEEAEKKSDPAS